MNPTEKPPLPKADIIGIMPEIYSLSFTPLKRQIDINIKWKIVLQQVQKKEFSTLKERKNKVENKILYSSLT